MGGRGFLGTHTGGGKQRKNSGSSKKKKDAGKHKQATIGSADLTRSRSNSTKQSRIPTGTGLLIERLTSEILASRICPMLTMHEVMQCRCVSAAARALYSCDEVWGMLCARSGVVAPPFDMDMPLWRYCRTSMYSQRWATTLGAALQPTAPAHDDCDTRSTAPAASVKSYSLDSHTARVCCIDCDVDADMICTADIEGKLCVWSSNGRLLGKTGLKKCSPVHLRV